MFGGLADEPDPEQENLATEGAEDVPDRSTTATWLAAPTTVATSLMGTARRRAEIYGRAIPIAACISQGCQRSFTGMKEKT